MYYILDITTYNRYKQTIRRMVRRESGLDFKRHILVMENALRRLNGLECVIRDDGQGPSAYTILMKNSRPSPFVLVLQAFHMDLPEITKLLPKDTKLVFQSKVNVPRLDSTWKKSIIYEKVI